MSRDPQPRSAARVTVGMPVYNGGAGFERALRAVREQTLRDIEIVISDNGSTDATPEVISRAAEEDPRITVLRQDPPVGVWDNFRAVLAAARTPYFMWAAADDRCGPTLAERTCAILDARDDVVLAMGETELEAPDGSRIPAAGAFALEGDERENVEAFLLSPIDNSRVYGLFRRDVLERAIPDREFFGMDWAISIATLREGRHALAGDADLVRGTSDVVKYLRTIETYTRRGPMRLAALWPFTWYTLRRLRPPLSATSLLLLARLNLWVHIAYCRWRYPWYGRLAYRLAGAAESLRVRVGGAEGRFAR
jgi:glycosyltransferase involved in cell wall biosynthesis